MRSARCWLPVIAGFALTVATLFAGAILTWIGLTLAFGLILDGATAAFERAGSVGNLTTYKQ